MSHLSPSIFLLWTILTATLGAFFVHHLWHFDRFQCLNVFRRPKNGAFSRFMTFSYLLAIPLLFIYTAGFAVIKFEEGYISLPSGSVVPKPYELWTPEHQACVYPLNMINALSWGTEAVTHLEELCFWLFLIHPSSTSWFKSIYFKVWAGGSVAAMILSPAVTAATKADPLRNEAWLQLVGSTVGLIITLGFLPILWVFPRFVQKVKNEGADKEVVTRLAKFHDLNITRIAFRFLFVVPFLVLSIDGLQPHSHHLNESNLWTEFLAMLSSVGCIVQSAITLLIFFPRNVELETQRWLREPPPKPRRIFFPPKSRTDSKVFGDHLQQDLNGSNYLLTDSPAETKLNLPHAPPIGQPYMTHSNLAYQGQAHQAWDEAYSMSSVEQQQWTDMGGGLRLEINHDVYSDTTLTLNPMAHLFTSPINIDPSDFPRRL